DELLHSFRKNAALPDGDPQAPPQARGAIRRREGRRPGQGLARHRGKTSSGFGQAASVRGKRNRLLKEIAMPDPIAQKLQNVSVDLKANVYFDGKVVSHSVYDAAGAKKTLGL